MRARSHPFAVHARSYYYRAHSSLRQKQEYLEILQAALQLHDVGRLALQHVAQALDVRVDCAARLVDLGGSKGCWSSAWPLSRHVEVRPHMACSTDDEARGHLAEERHLLAHNGHGLFNLPAVRCNQVVLLLQDPVQGIPHGASIGNKLHTPSLCLP